MRRAARTDTTQAEIVAALRQVGAKVVLLGGTVDAVVLFRGTLHLVEFKASATARRTATQRELVADGWPICFWASVDDAFAGIGVRVTCT